MMSVPVRIALIVAAVAGVAGEARGQADIGGAVRVENRVEGEVGGMPRPVATDARVFQDERITSFADSGATLRFLDETTMSMGPLSEVVLDRFVFDPDRTTGDIVFNVAKGAFRFVTGSAASESYRVVTPHAVIGTRGTDYGVYSIGLGTLVITHGGDSFACPLSQIHDPRPGGPGCCDLDADAAGFPVYGMVLQGSQNCVGPRRWNGTNPGILLSRRAIRETITDRDEPPEEPPPPPPPPPDDDDDNGPR